MFNYILQFALISLFLTLIVIVYTRCLLVSAGRRRIYQSTWKFSFIRLLVIISCPLIILLLFYLNYKRLGRTVHLEQSIINLFNFYFLINNLIYVKTSLIFLIVINILFFGLMLLIVLCISYYLLMIRVSFISLHYYLLYLDLYKVYPYEKLKLFIEFYLYKLRLILPKIDWAIDDKLRNYFDQGYANYQTFSQSNSFIWYMIVHRPLRNVVKILKESLGLILLFYYTSLLFIYGTIELKNIYYFLIYISIIRLISSIIYFIIEESIGLSLDFDLIICSVYVREDMSKNMLYPRWFGVVGNFNDVKGQELRKEASIKYYYGELKDLEEVHEYIYGEKSIDYYINEKLKKIE